MVEMSCEEHDRHAASTQFITHTVGRVLGNMNPSSTPIDTRGYQSLLALVDNTTHDSFELYYGLFMYNPVRHSQLSPRGLSDLLKLVSRVSGVFYSGCFSESHWRILSAVCGGPVSFAS